jgi:chemotaxis signal transduction protein
MHRQRLSVLVLGRNEHRVGLLIDGLPQALKQTERVDRMPQLPSSLVGYVSGVVVASGAIWLEFDHDAFFRAQSASASMQ